MQKDLQLFETSQLLLVFNAALQLARMCTNVPCTCSCTIVMRQQSIMRMSEAHARMHLRDHVREDDVDVAIQTILEVGISITAIHNVELLMCISLLA
jgi:MCM AAA-lid domain